jgi:hypothetical protein
MLTLTANEIQRPDYWFLVTLPALAKIPSHGRETVTPY